MDSITPVPQGYVFIKHLGNGLMGPTLMVHDNKGDILTCKVLKKKYLGDKENFQRFKERLDHIKTLGSPFIVPFKTIRESDEYLFLIRQYITYPCLIEYIEKQDVIDVNKQLAMWKVLARAVYQLHRHHIGSNSLKPSNLFVANDLCVIITDLYPPPAGFDIMTRVPLTGDVCFYAPEILTNSESPSHFADSWSLGILLSYMMSKTIPFNTKNLFSLISQVTKGEYVLPDSIPREVVEIIKSFVKVNPKERALVSSVLQLSRQKTVPSNIDEFPVVKHRSVSYTDTRNSIFSKENKLSLAGKMILTGSRDKHADSIHNLFSYDRISPEIKIKRSRINSEYTNRKN